MAKLFSMFLVLIALQACLILYTGQDAENTLIWDFVTNMSQWSTLGFVLALVGIAAGIGLIGVVAASVFAFKTDFLIFAPAIAGFITMGIVFSNFAKFLADQLIAILNPTCALPCLPVNFFVALIVGPIALYYVWTVIEWWRGKDYN